MTLDKRLVDDVIRLTKKFYRTGDTDYLPALIKVGNALRDSASLQEVNLIEALAKYIQTSGKGTYDNIYKALAIFGIIVEDKE